MSEKFNVECLKCNNEVGFLMENDTIYCLKCDAEVEENVSRTFSHDTSLITLVNIDEKSFVTNDIRIIPKLLFSGYVIHDLETNEKTPAIYNKTDKVAYIRQTLVRECV